jgi:hypothetical protein
MDTKSNPTRERADDQVQTDQDDWLFMQTLKKRDSYRESRRNWRALCVAIVFVVAITTFSGRRYEPDQDENTLHLTMWSWWGLKSETRRVRYGRQDGREESKWLRQTRSGDWVPLFDDDYWAAQEPDYPGYP